MKFDLTTVDTLQGLHAYMNTLINSNEEVLRYCLRKVAHYWGYKDGNYVYYMLAPPWVKFIVVSPYILYLSQNDVVNQSRNHGNNSKNLSDTKTSQVNSNNNKKPTLFSKDININ